MARLYGFIFIVVLLAVLALIAYVIISIGERKRKLTARQDERNDELLNRLHGHNLDDVDYNVQENRRHRERLRRNLDEMHGYDENDGPY